MSLLGGLSTHGTGRFERAMETSLKQLGSDPGLGLRHTAASPLATSWTVSLKRNVLFNKPPNGIWRMPTLHALIQHRGLDG